MSESSEKYSAIIEAARASIELTAKIKEERGIELLPPQASAAFGSDPATAVEEERREMDWRIQIIPPSFGEVSLLCPSHLVKTHLHPLHGLMDTKRLFYQFKFESLDELPEKVNKAIDWILEQLQPTN